MKIEENSKRKRFSKFIARKCVYMGKHPGLKPNRHPEAKLGQEAFKLLDMKRSAFNKQTYADNALLVAFLDKRFTRGDIYPENVALGSE